MQRWAVSAAIKEVIALKVATDIGGTFTDLVAIDESGSLILEKAHTTPPNFDQGVMDVLEKAGWSPAALTPFFTAPQPLSTP